MFSPQVLLLLPPLNSDKLLFSVVLGGVLSAGSDGGSVGGSVDTRLILLSCEACDETCSVSTEEKLLG